MTMSVVPVLRPFGRVGPPPVRGVGSPVDARSGSPGAERGEHEIAVDSPPGASERPTLRMPPRSSVQALTLRRYIETSHGGGSPAGQSESRDAAAPTSAAAGDPARQEAESVAGTLARYASDPADAPESLLDHAAALERAYRNEFAVVATRAEPDPARFHSAHGRSGVAAEVRTVSSIATGLMLGRGGAAKLATPHRGVVRSLLEMARNPDKERCDAALVQCFGDQASPADRITLYDAVRALPLTLWSDLHRDGTGARIAALILLGSGSAPPAGNGQREALIAKLKQRGSDSAPLAGNGRRDALQMRLPADVHAATAA